MLRLTGYVVWPKTPFHAIPEPETRKTLAGGATTGLPQMPPTFRPRALEGREKRTHLDSFRHPPSLPSRAPPGHHASSKRLHHSWGSASSPPRLISFEPPAPAEPHSAPMGQDVGRGFCVARNSGEHESGDEADPPAGRLPYQIAGDGLKAEDSNAVSSCIPGSHPSL